MTDWLSREELAWSSQVKALAMSMLVAAMMIASLLAPAPARASAFLGANGKIVFASDRTTGTGVDNPEGDLEIFSMNPDGTGLKQLTKNKETDSSPSYSPDGKNIVFQSLRTGNSEVFKMNANGKGQTNLTNNPALDNRPSFSSDAKRIIFSSLRSGNNDIFAMNADGTQQKALTSDPANDFNATFSPKGDEIAFMSNRDGDFEIFTMNPNGTGQTPLTANDFQDGDPSFSPEGDKITFDSNRDGQGDPNDFDVFVMNSSDGSGTFRLTSSRATDIDPAYSPDGTKVAYASTQDGGDTDVLVMDATNGANQTDITPNADFDDDTPEWQPTSTFTVTSAADSDDGVCDSDCTLREAINASNAPKAQPRSTIRFDIPGGGVQTITPAQFSPLPPITRPVTIDGYTQPGASPNTLAKGTNAKIMIELSGAETLGEAGLAIQGSSKCVIRGLAINRFNQGISLGSGSVTNRIEGNFIGTDPTGALDLGNSLAVALQSASGNMIGGTAPAARNIISGNGDGVVMIASSQGNKVLGNLIGTSASGTGPLGNEAFGVGLFFGAVSNNEIGNGTSAGSNTIAFNGNTGIIIDDKGETRNAISRNSIFSNTGFGIDLNFDGATANDPGDADTGANDLQNSPVLTSAKTSSTATAIAGKLNSTPGKTFKVEFFSNPPGTDEGKKFIGQKSVTTDSSGNISFALKLASKVPLGQSITATATDTSGNTSEFSAPRTVAKAITPAVKKVVPAENAKGVSPATNVLAFFSEAMDPSTINATTVKLRKVGTTRSVAATVSYDVATNKAVLNPKANLQLGTTYVATVTPGAKSLAGNALDQNKSKTGNQAKVWNFTVRK